MPFINVREVKAKIAFHEAQIDALRNLLKISETLSDKGTARHSVAGGAEPGRKGKQGAKGDGRKRGRRGMLSGSIIALLENSRGALSAGDIKNTLVSQGVIEKGSTTIYAMLLQMAKRGVIKKSKTAEGMAYSAGSGNPPAKGKRPGRPRGKKKSTQSKTEQAEGQ